MAASSETGNALHSNDIVLRHGGDDALVLFRSRHPIFGWGCPKVFGPEGRTNPSGLRRYRASRRLPAAATVNTDTSVDVLASSRTYGKPSGRSWRNAGGEQVFGEEENQVAVACFGTVPRSQLAAVGRPQAACRAVESDQSRSVHGHASAWTRFGRRLPSPATDDPRVELSEMEEPASLALVRSDHRDASLLVSGIGPETYPVVRKDGRGAGSFETSVSVRQGKGLVR